MSSKSRLKNIIANFNKAAVLVVGDIILDHFVMGRVSRISPEAPVPIVNVEHEQFALGGSANVIANIVSVGGNALGAGIIGVDEMAETLLKNFNQLGVPPVGIIQDKDRRTIVKSRIIANRQQQIARLDYEDLHAPPTAAINKTLSYIKKALPNIGALVISDYGKGFVCEELLKGIREMMAGKNIFVCVDPKKSNFDFYAGFDIITPNTMEALAAAGFSSRDGFDAIKVGELLMQRHDIGSLLITRSEEGMSLFERGDKMITHTHFPTQARAVFDVTGAGDTAIALLALAMAAGAALKEAVVLANLAAGIVVGKSGTASVSTSELLAAL